MTAATLTHLPLAAGGAVLASTGKAVLWVLSQYMRAPLANTAILTMVSLTALAGSNALYFQEHKHPAPLFSPAAAEATSSSQVAPVVPAVRPKLLPKLQPLPSAASGTATDGRPDQTGPIGNAEVFELQRKLQQLQLFDGTIDGYYGPQTARAIKKFQQLNGMAPTGELTSALLEAVRAASGVRPAPAATQLSAPEPLPTSDPLPKVVIQPTSPAAATEPEPAATGPDVAAKAGATLPPLPAPEPLKATLPPQQPAATASAGAESESAVLSTPMGRELPETPEAAFDLAVATAGDAIDTIIAGVQTVAMTKPAAKQQAVAQPFPPKALAPQAVAATAEPAVVAEPRPVPGQPLIVAEAVAPEEVPVLDTEAKPEELMPPFSVADPTIVAQVQRGLASLGFLHGPADGVAGAATAKAIRNFEVYYNYKVTGRISPELLDLLVQNGASI